MKDYILITDSTCDLPKEYYEDRGIPCLCFPYSLNDTPYMDDFGQSLSYGDFYKGMRNGAIPATSTINVMMYTEAFTPFLEDKKDILYLCFSSALSSSYQNAKFAAMQLMEQYPNRRIRVVDTRRAAVAQGLLLLHAHKQYLKGLTLDELVGWVDGFYNRVNAWFTVDDLSYLHRGGRISAVAATAGKMLKIKPILTIDPSGALINTEKINGRKKSIKRLAELYAEHRHEDPERPVLICHGDCLEEAEKLKERLMEKHGAKQVEIHMVGPIIGSHVGPGILGMSFLGK